MSQNKSSGKLFTVGIGLCLLILGVLGLPISGMAQTKPYAGVTLNVVNVEGWTVTEPLWDMLPEFEQKTGIKISVNHIPFAGLREKQFMEGMAQSGAYDVLCIFDGWMKEFQDFTLPQDDYIEADHGLDKWKAEQIPVFIEMGLLEGKLHYTVFMAGSMISLYREDLFDDPKEKADFRAKYGYELRFPQTFRELKDVAEFFTRDTDNDGEIDMWGFLAASAWPHGGWMMEEQMEFAGLGTGILDEEFRVQWGPAHPENYDTALKVARGWQDIFTTSRSLKESLGMQLSDVAEAYFAGRAAIAFSWLHDYWHQTKWPETLERIGPTVSAGLPSIVSTKLGGGILGSWGWGISVDSANKKAAWEFIKWGMDRGVQKKQMTPRPHIRGTFAPPWEDVAQWGLEKGYIPVATMARVRASRTRPRIVEYGEIEFNIFSKYTEQLALGKISPEEFLDITAKEIEDLLTEAGYYE